MNYTPQSRVVSVGTALIVVLSACGGSSSDVSTGPDVAAAPNGVSESSAAEPATTDDSGSATVGAAQSTSADQTSCSTDAFTTLCVVIEITGSVPAQGIGNHVISSENCAAFAAQVGQMQFTPIFDTEGGTSFSMGSFVDEYSGPGSYGLDQLFGPGSEWVLMIDQQTFTEGDASTGLFVTAADGSGSFSFTDFVEEADEGAIGGVVNWTCAD
jgi:hypothetical protein